MWKKWQFDSLLILELITLIFPWKVRKEEVTLPTSSKSFDLLFIPPFGWVRQVSCWINQFYLCMHILLYSNPHSLTKQMAATLISCSDFKKIIDSMFSKLQRSTSPAFRKIRRCTPIWYGFCFGFNHVFSWFYRHERIHDPVSVLRCAFNSVLLWNWRILNKNI